MHRRQYLPAFGIRRVAVVDSAKRDGIVACPFCRKDCGVHTDGKRLRCDGCGSQAKEMR